MKLNNLLVKQVFKFGLVGGTSTLINFCTFFIFYELLIVNYLFAAVLGYLIGALTGYFLNGLWTFESKRMNAVSMLSYGVLYFCTLCLSLVLLYLMVDLLALNIYFAYCVAIVATIVTNFIGMKLWVFGE